MAGTSEDFIENGYSYPKYLLEIEDKPLIQRIINSIENVSCKITCILRKIDQENFFLGDTLKILSPQSAIIEIPGDTKGAICTALFAIEDINNDEELLILNGDQLLTADISLAIKDFRSRNLDAGIVAIDAIHPKYSSLLLDENNLVVQSSEKRPISSLASTGCCYYKKGSDFVTSCFSVIEKDVHVQGIYYISSTFNEMILKQKKIGVYEISKKDYISFATFQMYENYRTSR